MKIDAVILHYGKINNTTSCLNSLRKGGGIRDIYIINNTPREITSKLSDYNVIVLSPEKNVGFSKGVNMGITKSMQQNSDAILLLNNDTIVKEGFLNGLVNEIDEEKVGITSPVIEFNSASGLVYDHGGRINKRTGATTHDNRENISKKQCIQPDFVSGCCMLIQTAAIKKIGLFDEQFFMYYEDVDFCLRMRKAKYKIYVVPTSVIHHNLTNKKSDKTVEQILKSSKRFYRKYHEKFQFRKVTTVRQSLMFAIKKPSRTFKILKFSLQ